MAANLQSLTALRGLAALSVLIFHCAPPLFGGAEQVPMPFDRGYLAVDLFFLLSGFVLMHVHERDFADGVAWADVKAFFRARFARTYPIHLLMLLLLLPLYGTQSEFSGLALVHNLLLTQAPWYGEMSWNYGAWSISAEWHAYLLFPFLVMPWRRRSPRGVIAVLLLSLAVLSLAVIAAGNTANIAATPAVLLRCLPEFIAGMGLYRVYRAGWLKNFLVRDITTAGAAALAVGIAAFARTDIAVIVALAVLLLACAHNNGRASRLLAIGPLTFLGRISYSLYMVQMIAAAMIMTAAARLPILGDGAVETIVFAALCFAMAIPLSRYVEYPMRDWLRRRPAKAPS